ncbi:MAG TPA: hypothetical protein EYO08_01560 [Candidatus Marinimicrobia bacterium]|nr:hypothetical protein [Candidatus Neomarinimicrobiota bacterium]
MVQSISKRSLLFLTLFSLVIAAPSGDDDTILGKWKLDPEIFIKALVEEGLEGEELELATTAVEAVSMVFEFNEDGTFSMSISALGESESVAGAWKLDGTSLSMRLEDAEEWDAAEITLGDGQLVIANEDETLVFKRSE